MTGVYENIPKFFSGADARARRQSWCPTPTAGRNSRVQPDLWPSENHLVGGPVPCRDFWLLLSMIGMSDAAVALGLSRHLVRLASPPPLHRGQTPHHRAVARNGTEWNICDALEPLGPSERITNFPLPFGCAPMFPGAATHRVSRTEQVNAHVALLLRGESFREGGRGNRLTCASSQSWEWQRAITHAQVRRIANALIREGRCVDIFFATYGCAAPNEKWNDDLVRWFGPHLKDHTFLQRAPGQDQSTTLLASLKLLATYSSRWGKRYGGGVIVTRMDFALFPDLTTVRAEAGKKLLAELGHKLLYIPWGGGDVFFGVPWYFMNCFASVYRSTCFQNTYAWGENCALAMRAQLVDQSEQLSDAFPNELALPARQRNWMIHPWVREPPSPEMEWHWKHKACVELSFGDHVIGDCGSSTSPGLGSESPCNCSCYGGYVPDERNSPPNDCWIKDYGYDKPCCTPSPPA